MGGYSKTMVSHKKLPKSYYIEKKIFENPQWKGRFNTLRDRFWSKVLKTSNCWEWIGTIHKRGYGHFKVGRDNNLKAHRVSYIIGKGSIPTGLYVLHHCDNPKCVRPSHLFIGTQRDNIQDAVSKSRMHQGEKNHTAKITVKDVKEIRLKYIPYKCGCKKLGREYGLAERTVHQIVKGQIWKHVK